VYRLIFLRWLSHICLKNISTALKKMLI